jgi:S-adenosylmethionine:tRNA ribosyltransferase-isomerase
MIGKKKKYKLSDFRYQLPKKYIAQKPKQKRDGSKMMVLDREDKSIKHKKFSDITDYFQKNDLLILNDTKVFPAKLYATKDRTDAKVEIFLLRELGDRLWEVLVKPARKVRIGNKLILSDGLFCDVIDNTVSGGRVVRFEFDNGISTIF